MNSDLIGWAIGRFFYTCAIKTAERMQKMGGNTGQKYDRSLIKLISHASTIFMSFWLVDNIIIKSRKCHILFHSQKINWTFFTTIKFKIQSFYTLHSSVCLGFCFVFHTFVLSTLCYLLAWESNTVINNQIKLTAVTAIIFLEFFEVPSPLPSTSLLLQRFVRATAWSASEILAKACKSLISSKCKIIFTFVLTYTNKHIWGIFYIIFLNGNADFGAVRA